MEELEEDFVADLRTLINDERFYDKERFYKIIASLKVMPEILTMAKKND
jgi:hypothetical protein